MTASELLESYQKSVRHLLLSQGQLQEVESWTGTGTDQAREKARQKVDLASAATAAARDRIITVIDSLPELQAAVIQERYLHLGRFGHFQTWEEIAGSLCYGTDYIRHVHSKALKSIGTILETGTLDT